MNIAGCEINLDVFRRYAGHALPRHVSYPMPTWWEDVSAADGAKMLHERPQADPPRGLSLYLHVPFCDRLCRYCACTRVPLSHKSPDYDAKTDAYVTAVEREVELLAEAMAGKPRVQQLHWGGGTPTFLTCQRLARVHAAVRSRFDVAPDAELAIELDPRTVNAEMLAALRELGINRVSFGIQDFDADVQKHVGRVQPYELVRDVVQQCRDLGIASVNFDLIYGLPLQTVESVERTVMQTIELSPDRIAYYQFAQIPDKIAVQRGLDYTRLPDSETKLAMFLVGLRRFQESGYEFVGLDHFAKPDEALVQARDNGTLQRNFQGMTTGGGLDLVGIGASSISHLAEYAFLQNVRGTADYEQRLQDDALPIFRAKRLTADDVIRQATLSQLYCYGVIDPRQIASRYGIVFDEYFAREREIMQTLAADGLVELRCDGRIVATMPLGRVLIRTIAAVFDAYLSPDAWQSGDRQYFSANA